MQGMDLTRSEWAALLLAFPVLVAAGVFVPWLLRAGSWPGWAFWVGLVLIAALAAGIALLAVRIVGRSVARSH